MDSGFREVFMTAVVRFKRVDLQKASDTCLQPNELMIISRAAHGCTCTSRGFHVSEIGQELHISKAAVSQTLNALERKGWITRSIDPDDRRKITVMVTAAGLAQLETARSFYDRILYEILDRFGEKNTETLLTLLNQLMDILEEL